MADKRELQIFPNKDDTSIVLSDGRNSLAARGRKDVASLLAQGLKRESLAAFQPQESANLVAQLDANAQYERGLDY